jgi:hypothetical protein
MRRLKKSRHLRRRMKRLQMRRSRIRDRAKTTERKLKTSMFMLEAEC